MKSRKELTICIPTFNREIYLNRLLESIYSQKESENIAIAISDNCSQDRTKELVNEWKKNTNLDISISINKANLGADKNYFQAVNMSQTEYTWLLGSDDWLVEGALRRILCIMKENDIIISSRNNVFQNKKVEIEHHIKLCDEDKIDDYIYEFNINSEKALINYLEKCQTVAGVFSYISSIIFNSKKIKFSKIDPTLIGTYYSHVKPFFYNLISYDTKIIYVSNPLINNTMGNDSFYTNWVSRMNIDLKGYLLNLKFIKSEKNLYTSFTNILIRTYKLNDIFNVFIFSINSIKDDICSFKLWNQFPNRNMFLYLIVYISAIPLRILYFFYKNIKNKFKN